MEPTTLEYGSPSTPEPRRRPHVLVLLACMTLTLVALITCVRIEWLNARAGAYLPREDGKEWPTAPATENGFRVAHIGLDPTLASRPLSPAERQEVRRYAARNRLRDVVRTWGLAQHAVVPALLAITGRMLLRRPTLGALAFAAACCGVGVACGVSMLYRGYFGSPGLY